MADDLGANMYPNIESCPGVTIPANDIEVCVPGVVGLSMQLRR